MDTLSRDSNNSGSIMPLVGAIAGGLALVLSIVALVKLSTLQKTVATQGDDVAAKVTAMENEVRAATTKSEEAVKGLRTGVQQALDQVGGEIGTIKASLTKIEEAMKKPAPAAAGGKGGGGGVVTGTVDANGNYSVAPGDTVSKIAKKFATRVDAIEAENPGLDPAKLKVGQKIKIPKK